MFKKKKKSSAISHPCFHMCSSHSLYFIYIYTHIYIFKKLCIDLFYAYSPRHIPVLSVLYEGYDHWYGENLPRFTDLALPITSFMAVHKLLHFFGFLLIIFAHTFLLM